MRGSWIAVGMLVGTALVACDTSNYAFKVDNSIEIVEPSARADVSVPVTIRWTDERPPADAKVAPADADAEYYAIFLDQAPMGPGKDLESLLDRGPRGTRCIPRQPCPTTEQLATLGVHLAAETTMLLEFVADLRPSDRGDSKDKHEVIIVRMRGDRRVGESAFLQTFFVTR